MFQSLCTAEDLSEITSANSHVFFCYTKNIPEKEQTLQNSDAKVNNIQYQICLSDVLICYRSFAMPSSRTWISPKM